MSGPGRRTRAANTPAAPLGGPAARKPLKSKLLRQVAILGLVLAAVALSLGYPLRDYLDQRAELAAAVAQRQALEQTVANLELQQAALADPDYIKAEAKKRLQYVMPGDTVYVVQAPVLKVAPEAAAGAPVATATTQPWYSTLWGTLSSPGGQPGDQTPVSDASAAPDAPATPGAGG
ncbi:FtsB family cell division protein [Nakamurella antarctica]|uniref:FtsB family cell division protein n=1 Tax=Nakamurella antarctica TaxID=1902245 RepID=UPI0013DDBE7D|nr:septum formation initiator family protein [Nakamurella antarctica]